jgi:hypothetical protein
MLFNYKRYRRDPDTEITRAIIRVVLRNPQDPASFAVAYEALVDSGSDHSIFPAHVGELLGLDVSAGLPLLVGGVVAGERRPMYLHPVEMELTSGGEEHRFLTTAAFMPELSGNGHGLLGRWGFFDRFTFVKFKDFDALMEVGKLQRL